MFERSDFLFPQPSFISGGWPSRCACGYGPAGEATHGKPRHAAMPRWRGRSLESRGVKASNYRQTKILLVYQHHDNMWMKAGYGYAEGIYDVEANFSLIINDVMIENDGYYFCEILDVDTGRSFANKTRVEVFGEWDQVLFFEDVKISVSV